MLNPHLIKSPHSILANRISRLAYDYAQGDLDRALIYLKGIPEAFADVYRNAGELSEREIPLFWLYTLRKGKALDFGYKEAVYLAHIARAEKGCRDYFGPR